MAHARAYLEALLHDPVTDHPRVGVSFWRHFYEAEFVRSAYVDAMVRFYTTYRWDLLKLNPRSSYYVEAWGARFEPSGNPHVGPRMVYTPIQALADWDRVIRPIPATEGVFADQLEAIRQIRDRLGPDVPIVQTVFAPIEVCSRFLPSKWDLAVLAQADPDRFHTVFQVVTEVLTEFAIAAIQAGADGIFFATQWATHRTPSAIFETFERKYDLALLRAVRPYARYIVLHVCGQRNRILEMLDYPVDIFHWDWIQGENPPFTAVELQTDAVLANGVFGKGLLRFGPPDRIYDYVHRAHAPRRWLVSAECTFPTDVPHAHLMAVRRAVADLRGEVWEE